MNFVPTRGVEGLIGEQIEEGEDVDGDDRHIDLLVRDEFSEDEQAYQDEINTPDLVAHRHDEQFITWLDEGKSYLLWCQCVRELIYNSGSHVLT